MSPNAPLEQIASQVQSLNRDECIDQLLCFQDIPLDFTPEALNGMSTEALKHVLMAAFVTVFKHHRYRSAA